MSKSSSNARPARVREAVLSLGSNTGAREDTILAAVHELGLETGIAVKRHSSLYETEPVGDGFNRAFVNSVCIVETSLDPMDLLGVCKRLERRFGREETAGTPDRPLDIDIVLYDGVTVRTPLLEIPHPRMAHRLFVLLPLAEIAPQVHVRQCGVAVADLIEGLDHAGWARKISSRGTGGKTS